jgi:hypothetical protein
MDVFNILNSAIFFWLTGFIIFFIPTSLYCPLVDFLNMTSRKEQAF